MSEIKISLKTKETYLANPVDLKLDTQWDIAALGERASQKGIYIIFTEMPDRIIYVGKTRGETMDFATRLYRHATEGASQNSKVYRKLEKISKGAIPIKVALINLDDIRHHFRMEGVALDITAMVDILEIVMIQYLHPEIQFKGEGR